MLSEEVEQKGCVGTQGGGEEKKMPTDLLVKCKNVLKARSLQTWRWILTASSSGAVEMTAGPCGASVGTSGVRTHSYNWTVHLRVMVV